MLSRRTALVFLGVTPLVLSSAVRAQSRPSGIQLERMMVTALRDPETVTFARPQVLGFDQPVVTHQLSLTQGPKEYFFAVTNPRLNDGLVFFSHEPAQRTYRMHRTDTHLRRVNSASNNLNQGDGGLVAWDGAAADSDFAEQLAVWAAQA